MNQINRKRWVQKEMPSAEKIEKLKKELNINDIFAILIAQRNIDDYQQARKFFEPTTDDLNDPFLMKNMKTVVDRINRAIQENQRILLYGDYDVDGTTAVAMLYNYISGFYRNLEFYIPDRFTEGYGISKEGINKAIEGEVKLIIALDCGIKDIDKVTYANENQIDVIICDHHTPGDILPDAYAILNPKQSDCDYPFKELSGCGIGFKVLEALSHNFPNLPDPMEYIDFVAVSIASDIVPIVDENRTLTRLGLKKINQNPHIAFRALIEFSSLRKQLTVSDLVFIIGPRLNASGRIDHASDSVKLLISRNEKTAKYYASLINEKNFERKDIDATITQQAIEEIENNEEFKRKKTTVLYNPTWHKGVVGIVASRVIEHFYKPTVILTESEGMMVGSARSIAGFDLYSALEKCSHLFEKFGGHQYAAGLTIKYENLEPFRQAFEEVASSILSDEMMIPVIEYDLELPINYINYKFVKNIQKFAPFGPGNMKPRFISRNIEMNSPSRIVGSNHLKLSLKNENGAPLDAIAYGMGDLIDQLDSGHPVHICYTLDEYVRNGLSSIQLNIKDLVIDS